ncbi:MAG: hypothetical protein M3O09_06390 [Acidobacteriota bacterium]|nr:hypothetical protein [Acidobacteriota bacterium]
MVKIQDRLKLGAALRELSAVGSPVDVSVAEDTGENQKVEIEQIGGPHESMIFELPDTRSGYILDLEIVNQTSKTLYCSDIELRVPWEDASLAWLPDPKDTEQRFSYIRKNRYGRRERVDVASELYCFPGGSQLEYPRDEVLNHILLKQCTIPPHRPLKGLILAAGTPMPNVLRHGQWLDATFSIFASDHDEFSVKAQFWVERLQFKPKPRTHNLYEPIGLKSGPPVEQQSDGRGAHDSKTGTSETVRRTRPEDSRGQAVD